MTQWRVACERFMGYDRFQVIPKNYSYNKHS